MNTKHFVSGMALLSVAVVILGLCIRSGINNFAYRDRVVTVKGLSERDVEASTVTWPITYSVAGNELLGLYDRMTAYNSKIERFLTSNGIDKDEFSFGAPDIYDATTNRWNNNEKFNYSLTCAVTVRTDKVKLVKELVNRQSELLKAGVPYSNSYINYEYTLLNQIKPEMIAEATRNAREAADRFAADSGSKVGKIKNATQGQFSIEDANSGTPYLKRVRVVTTIVYYLED